jgi:hypothetical protein
MTQWEVLPSKGDLTGTEWRTEYIDQREDGQCYVTIFSGPYAKERAEEYAALMNAKLKTEVR